MLLANTKIHSRCQGFLSTIQLTRETFYSQKNNKFILPTDGGNFCLYFFNTCKDTSQGEGLSAGGISLNQKKAITMRVCGSIMFSPLATEVRHQHYEPPYSLVSIRGVCISLFLLFKMHRQMERWSNW